MNTYPQGKEYLKQIGIDLDRLPITTSEDLFSAIAFADIYSNKVFVAPTTPPEKFLDTLGLPPEYFTGKNVLDIGSGFGGLPFVLEPFVHHYVCVDPSRGDQRANALSRNITIQGYSLGQDQHRLEDIHKQVRDFDWDNTLNAECIYHSLIAQENALISTVKHKKAVFDYLCTRDTLNLQEHPKLSLNPSYGESIVGVANDSQDTVLISHVLDKKDTSNYFGVLAEASRVLKPGGEILIVEDKDQKMLEILRKLGLPWGEKDGKLFCKIKKSA